MQARGLDLSQRHGARAVGPRGLVIETLSPLGPRKGPQMTAVSGPLRGPFTIMLTPQATQTYGLCTLGLFLFKAAGLVQAVGLPAY